MPMAAAFFVCLVMVSLYQNIVLYQSGVLDGIFGKSLLLLIVHHSGFVALSAVLLVFFFNYLEGKRRGWGRKAVGLLIIATLVLECLLTGYFVQFYETFGHQHLKGYAEAYPPFHWFVPLCIGLMTSGAFLLFTKWLAPIQALIGRMYCNLDSLYPVSHDLNGRKERSEQ